MTAGEREKLDPNYIPKIQSRISKANRRGPEELRREKSEAANRVVENL